MTGGVSLRIGGTAGGQLSEFVGLGLTVGDPVGWGETVADVVSDGAGELLTESDGAAEVGVGVSVGVSWAAHRTTAES